MARTEAPAGQAPPAEAITAGLLALAAGAAFVVVSPGGPTPEAAARAVIGGGAALAGLLSAAGAGGALLQRLAPDLVEGDRGLLHAVATGLLLWAALASVVAAAGLLTPTIAAALPAALATGWLFRPPVAMPRLPPLALAIGLLALIPGLLDALAPPVDTDELYQHLALPGRMLANGGFVGGTLLPDGSRPQTLHVVYASLLALGGETAPRLFHLGLTAVTLAGVHAVGRAFLGPTRGAFAALLLVGSLTFLQTSGLAANDLPTSLAVLAALDAGLRGRAVPLALHAGLALGLKYTAGGAIAGVFLAARIPWSARFAAGIAALALVAPWWVRNAVDGLHPLFPFAGWDAAAVHPSAPGAEGIRFQYLDKYGAGRDLAAFLLLPWNAVMTADPERFRFLGRLSPAFLGLALPALLALRPSRDPAGHVRRIALAAACAAAWWALGPHWLRYLLPGLPLLALALAAGVPGGPGRPARLGRGLVLSAVLLGLPANTGGLLVRAADRLPAATGHEDREAFLVRHHPPAAAVAWANAHLPADARVALLYDWSAWLLERQTVLGSVEDHVPVRWWLKTRGDDALRALSREGVTHLLYTPTPFLEKLYPSLRPAEVQAELNAPGELLGELLLRDATLIHQDGRTRIYQLSPVEPSPSPDVVAP